MSNGAEAQTSVVFSTEGALPGERLSDRATDRLRTLIISLEVEPGTLLDEEAVSQRLGIGRTPLREAIFRLAVERLVDILPRRAVAVSPITITDLQQIFEARADIEGAAARLAATRAKPTHFDRLTELNERARSLSYSDDWMPLHVVHCDFTFHHVLAKSSGNTYLFDSVWRMLGPAMRLSFLSYRRGQRSDEMHQEHAEIIRAIVNHDPDEAEHQMRCHIINAKDRTLSRL